HLVGQLHGGALGGLLLGTEGRDRERERKLDHAVARGVPVGAQQPLPAHCPSSRISVAGLKYAADLAATPSSPRPASAGRRISPKVPSAIASSRPWGWSAMRSSRSIDSPSTVRA